MKTVSRGTFAFLIMSAIGAGAQQAPIMAVNAAIGSPVAVVPDANGNVYFVASPESPGYPSESASGSFNQVFKIDQMGTLTVVAGTSVAGYSGDGGPAVSAELNSPWGLAIDSAGNLYIADSGNNRVRMVSPAGIITTIAGNGQGGYPLGGQCNQGCPGDGGPATSAEVGVPGDLAIDGAGNLYIAAAADCCGIIVRMVSLASGIITTAAGGNLPIAGSQQGSIAVTQMGTLYIAAYEWNVISVTLPPGAVSPVCGGAPCELQFYVPSPTVVAVDRAGNLYAQDEYGIYAVSSTGLLTLVAGGGSCGCLGDGGPAVNAQLYANGIAFDSADNLYIADSENQRIRKVSSATGVITTIAGSAPVTAGVVSGASFQDNMGLAPASWVSIFGAGLSESTRTWQAGDFLNGLLPTSLDGVSVTIDGLQAYVEYISPIQINVLAPDFASGVPVQVQVTAAGQQSNSFTANTQQFVPAFFTFAGGKYVAALHADYSYLAAPSLVAGATPAQPGEVILLYGTGFGPTNPVLPAANLVTTAEPLANTVQITIGGVAAPVAYAGLVGAGLDQFNVTVPNVPDGDATVVAQIGGVQTQAGVSITVQH